MCDAGAMQALFTPKANAGSVPVSKTEGVKRHHSCSLAFSDGCGIGICQDRLGDKQIFAGGKPTENTLLGHAAELQDKVDQWRELAEIYGADTSLSLSCAICILKTEVLPRQARDEQRKSWRKRGAFLQACRWRRWRWHLLRCPRSWTNLSSECATRTRSPW